MPSPLFARDLFSFGGRTGNSLNGSTSSGGGVWSYKAPGNSGANVITFSAAGRAYVSASPGATTCDMYLSDPAPSADYRVSALFDVLSVVTQNVSINCRSTIGAVTHYQAQKSGNTVALYRWLNGAFTQIGSSIAHTALVGNSFLLMVEAVGTVISAYIFEPARGWLMPAGTFQATPVPYATGTDTAITAAGYAGLSFFSNPVTATTGFQFAEFNAGYGFLVSPASVNRGVATTVAFQPINQIYNPAAPPTLTATNGTISTALTLTNSYTGSFGYTAPGSGVSDAITDGTSTRSIGLTGPAAYPPAASETHEPGAV